MTYVLALRSNAHAPRFRMHKGTCIIELCHVMSKRQASALPSMSTEVQPRLTHHTFKPRLKLISVAVTLLASILLARCSTPLRACWPSSTASFRLSRFSPGPNTNSDRAFTNMAYEKEQQVAIAAVLKACDVAQATFQKLVNDETVTKKDKSPVTGEFHGARIEASSG